jgi:hypothetical protein
MKFWINSWSNELTLTTTYLYGVWGSSVMFAGVRLHYSYPGGIVTPSFTNGAWSSTGTSYNRHDVWGSSSSDVFGGPVATSFTTMEAPGLLCQSGLK